MRTRSRAAAAAILSVVLASGLTSYAGSAGAASRDQRAASSTSSAQRALARAQAVLAGRAPGRDATMTLLQLVRHRDQLQGDDLAAAKRVLSRPTDPDDEDYYGNGADVLSDCGTYVCVHWVEAGDDQTDSDFAQLTLETMDAVHATYLAAGYRPPLPDSGLGGNNKPDVYLANIGPEGLYGYCTSDDDESQGYDIWAYCVLDNDYSSEEFGTNTPVENMEVTAAHEYFHAVQFGYDSGEDGWFMEATATWAEDEVFDDVDDNINYLAGGPLGRPDIALDKFGGSHHYGDWIFFRYLTETLDATEGDLPRLVLDFWERADSTNGEAEDYYSLQAIKAVLSTEGWSLKNAFASFAAANNFATVAYEEGEANDYPLPPYAFPTVHLTPSSPSSGFRTAVVDHLASATGAYVPSSSMTGAWQVRVKVDMASRRRGSMAVVISYSQSGDITQRLVTLNRDGDGSVTVDFSYADVAAVEVVLVNASDRFECWVSNSSPYACYGTPRDDNLKQRVSASAIRG